MTQRNYLIISLGIFLVLSSCRDTKMGDPDDLSQQQRVEIENFIEANNLNGDRHSDGFYTIVIQENPNGTTQSSGKILGIYYSMSIMDGQEISFYLASNGPPLRLKQGVNSVVPVGLDAGLDLMREGEIYRFILPSALAFGNLQFSTLIPPNSIIDVEVELVTIQNETDVDAEELALIDTYIQDNNLNNLTVSPLDSVQILNSGLHYKRVAAGAVGNNPSNGELITITYDGTLLDGSQFDATTGNDTFQFTSGIGEVIGGLDEGTSRMEKGERALLIIPSSLAYGASVRVMPDFLIDDMIERLVVPDYVAKVQPYQVLIFDVRLAQ